MKNLHYDGLYAGSFYCELSNTEDTNQDISSTFLYMHKLEISLLEKMDHLFNVRILQNRREVYSKDFHLHIKSKALFPNIKVPVRMSDVLTIIISHQILNIRKVAFRLEEVKRGKTSCYEVWLRNPLKNKVGDLKI